MAFSGAFKQESLSDHENDSQDQGEEPGEMVTVSAQILETGEEEEGDENEDYEDTDPSQLLEINHEEEYMDSNHQADPPPRPLGLLEQALTAKRPHEDVDPLHMPHKKSNNSSYPTVDINLEESLAQAERRSITQVMNSKPRIVCPICGDKANGIHYGIYTCEGCKNFFKRSVTVISMGRPYVCKGNMNCNITLFEDDGLTRRRTRCQFCRYQACLNAGMMHMGRTGRQIYGPKPVKNDDKSAMTSSDHSIHETDNGDMDNEQEEDNSNEEFQRQLEQIKSERVKNEMEYLKSRVRELETSVAEKTRQLDFQKSQIESLTKECELYERRYINNGNVVSTLSRSGNGIMSNGVTDEEVSAGSSSSASARLSSLAQFANGSVTITSIGKRHPKF